MNLYYEHIKRHIEAKGTNRPVFIFDLDGTLSDGTHRLDFLPTENLHLTESWAEFNELAEFDSPIEDTIAVMNACHQAGTVIILTGRSNETVTLSVIWLAENGATGYDFLVMRDAKDNRKDTVIKEEFLRFIGLHRITAAWDDSPNVVVHFRKLGITTYQVCQYDQPHAHLQSHGVDELKAECDHVWSQCMEDTHATCINCGETDEVDCVHSWELLGGYGKQCRICKKTEVI